MTPAEKGRLTEYREQIARELPDLTARDQMRKDARDESTLSGELRRAIRRVTCRWRKLPRARASRRSCSTIS